MRSLRSSLAGTALLAAPLALVAIVGAMLAPSDQRIVVNFFVTLVLALGLQAFSGTSGVLSFGHISFMGVGAYVTAMLVIPPELKADFAPSLPGFVADATLPFGVAILAGAVAAAVVAGVLGLAFARMEEDAMSMATLSLLLVFVVVFQGASGVTGGSPGVYGVPEWTTLPIALGFAVVAIAIAHLFKRSRTGLQLRATRTDALAGRSLGIRLVRVRWIGWTLGGALVGLGGGVFAGSALAFSPEQFDLDLTFTVLAAIVVGGITSVSGTVLGVALTTVAVEVLRRAEDASGVTSLAPIVFAVLLLLILRWRPDGVVGRLELPEALSRRRTR
jgi:branched-chain amino acid transport system permease protein